MGFNSVFKGLKVLKLHGEGKGAMKTRAMELEHHTFLTTTLDGQWSAACFHSFTLTKDSEMSNVQ